MKLEDLDWTRNALISPPREFADFVSIDRELVRIRRFLDSGLYEIIQYGSFKEWRDLDPFTAQSVLFFLTTKQ